MTKREVCKVRRNEAKWMWTCARGAIAIAGKGHEPDHPGNDSRALAVLDKVHPGVRHKMEKAR